MNSLLAKYNVPGAALAVSKNGRLVYTKGFGYANIARRERVTPRTLFRISSVSKPLASVVALRLVEQGKLKLTDRPYEILGELPSLSGRRINPKAFDITIEDLLNHTSGQASYNRRGRISSPMQPPLSRTISKLYGVPHPPPFKYVAAYMQSKPMINTPGKAFKYSNYGYALLGAVVEKVVGRSFEAHTRSSVLRPIGISCMRFGATRRSQAVKDEASYYDLVGASPIRSVFDDAERDFFPYAGRHNEGWGAAGAWVASPVDIVQLVNHVDGLRPPALLPPRMVKKMLARNVVTENRKGFWYGLGWRVQNKRIGEHWYHDGASNGGAAAIMLRTNDGVVWSALFNRRLPAGRALYKEFNKQMWSIVRSIKNWPAHDLFGRHQCS